MSVYSVDIFHIHEHQHAPAALLISFLTPDFSWQCVTVTRCHSCAQGTTRADECGVTQHPVTKNEKGESERQSEGQSFKDWGVGVGVGGCYIYMPLLVDT